MLKSVFPALWRVVLRENSVLYIILCNSFTVFYRSKIIVDFICNEIGFNSLIKHDCKWDFVMLNLNWFITICRVNFYDFHMGYWQAVIYWLLTCILRVCSYLLSGQLDVVVAAGDNWVDRKTGNSRFCTKRLHINQECYKFYKLL